jgi:dTDP-4-amino-4,6-dideoxygalactose transaminase
MPTKPDFIPITMPWLGDAESEAISRALASGWVSQGPEVASFEGEFCEVVGADHACAVSSCTSALHLALLAVGVRPGDEVVTVSHSFIATANAVRYCQATPVFVDIQPETFNMDPALLEAAIGPRVRAILCVHQLGMPCDLEQILAIGRAHGLPVVEDAACAIGSEIRTSDGWQLIGRPHGDVACFSFHPRKLLTTGDGGMLTTNNPEYDRLFRLLRQHYMDVPDTVRHGSSEVLFESYPGLGFNYRMTDIQGAMGRVQLPRLPEIVSSRRRLAQRYGEELAHLDGVGLPMEPEWARSNWQSFCVRLPEGHDQRVVMQSMLDAGIATRRGVMCMHREPSYPQESWRTASDSDDGLDHASLGHSEQAQDHTIVLPLYSQMSEQQQDRVMSQLEEALRV